MTEYKRPIVVRTARIGKGAPGNAPFIPLPEERRLVTQLASTMVPQHLIASMIREGISIKTLVKCFRQELDQGKAMGIANVCGKMFESAMQEDLKAGAQERMFILKTQAGFSEKSTVNVVNSNVDQLTDEQLDAKIRDLMRELNEDCQ